MGDTAIGTWSYEYTRSPDSAPGDSSVVRCHRSTRIRDPEGNDSVFYFSTSNSSHLWSYGLGFTRCAPGEGYSATGPFLSSEVYQGTVETGTKVRSVFVEYDSDGHGLGGVEVNQEKNHRLVYRKTVFHDDGERFRDEGFSDYDGVSGHRTRTVSGNFFAANDNQTVTTDLLPAGTLVVDPETGSTAGSTFVMPSSSEPWLFGLYTERQVTAANDTATTEFCFDDATGFLERTRVLAGSARAANDLLSVFEPELDGAQSTGRVATEKLYGGDDQGTMDGTYTSLCDMTLPAQAEYQTEHTYSAGVLATSTAVDACDGDAVLSLTDLTIDANTGLASASRDAAGVETVFVYDSLGRLTDERPADSA